MSDPALSGAALFWNAFGVVGGVIFYSRFYVQWLYSEFKRRSIVPPLFWYQSAIGSFTLLMYAIYCQSPLGALSQSVNIVPYTRNLVYIWKEQGKLSKSRNVVVHAFVGVVAVTGITVTLWLWWREYRITSGETVAQQRQTWFWLAVGLVGQGLFASRFLVQWIATERSRKSVVPPIFWYISLLAAALQCVTFFQRGGGELVYAIGLIATMVVYVRNIWLIRTRPPEENPSS